MNPICYCTLQAGGDLVESPAYFGLIRSFLSVRERFPAASTQLALLPSLQRPVAQHELMLRAIIARITAARH